MRRPRCSPGTRPATSSPSPTRRSTPDGSRRWPSSGRAALQAGDPAAARALLDEALGLWRGAALLEFSHLDFAWGFAARLEERRLVATEDRIDADLRLGRHTAVVGELGELVAANPLREQLRHHMALALYRSGRQAEALRILDDARRTLRNQLGIDPGRPLVDLEAAILSQDPALTLEAAAAPGAAPRRPSSPTGTGRSDSPADRAPRSWPRPTPRSRTSRPRRWSGARSSCAR